MMDAKPAIDQWTKIIPWSLYGLNGLRLSTGKNISLGDKKEEILKNYHHFLLKTREWL